MAHRIPTYQIVISAHGIRLPMPADPRRRTRIEIPKNFSIHILPENRSLICEPRYQTGVCACDPAVLAEIGEKFEHFNGPLDDAPRNRDIHTIQFNMYFTGNPPGAGGFLTGIVLCKTPRGNIPIWQLEEGEHVTLEHAIQFIHGYMHGLHADERYRVHITVLTCTGGDGARIMPLGRLAPGDAAAAAAPAAATPAAAAPAAAADAAAAAAGAAAADAAAAAAGAAAAAAAAAPGAGGAGGAGAAAPLSEEDAAMLKEIFGPYEGGARKSRRHKKRKYRKSRKMRHARSR